LGHVGFRHSTAPFSRTILRLSLIVLTALCRVVFWKQYRQILDVLCSGVMATGQYCRCCRRRWLPPLDRWPLIVEFAPVQLPMHMIGLVFVSVCFCTYLRSAVASFAYIRFRRKVLVFISRRFRAWSSMRRRARYSRRFL